MDDSSTKAKADGVSECEKGAQGGIVLYVRQTCRLGQSEDASSGQPRTCGCLFGTVCIHQHVWSCCVGPISRQRTMPALPFGSYVNQGVAITSKELLRR